MKEICAEGKNELADWGTGSVHSGVANKFVECKHPLLTGIELRRYAWYASSRSAKLFLRYQRRFAACRL